MRKLLLLALFLFILIFFSSPSYSEAQVLTCNFDVSSTLMKPGEDITVTVNANKNTTWTIVFSGSASERKTVTTDSNTGRATYVKKGIPKGDLKVELLSILNYKTCAPTDGINVSVDENNGINPGGAPAGICLFDALNFTNPDINDPSSITAVLRQAKSQTDYKIEVKDESGKQLYTTTTNTGPSNSYMLFDVPKAKLVAGTLKVYIAEASTGKQCTNSPIPLYTTGERISSNVKCLNTDAPFCLTNNPCVDDNCQVFNCRENNGIYRCLPPTTECGDDSDLTDDDRCLYSQECDPAFFACTIYECRPPASFTSNPEIKVPKDWEIQKYNTVCNKPQEKEDPDPPAPNPPCDNEGLNSGTDCDSVATAVGSINTQPEGLIGSIFAVVLSLSGGLALLLIIYGGYQLMVSRAKPEAMEAARDQITAAIIGLLFIILSLVILEIIGVDILKIPGFGGTSPIGSFNPF